MKATQQGRLQTPAVLSALLKVAKCDWCEIDEHTMKLFLTLLFAVSVRAQLEGMTAASALAGMSDFSSIPECA